MKKIIITLFLLAVPLNAHAAKMALSPATGEFPQNCPVAVNMILNTEGVDTMAADAFLNFNPNEIEILDQMAGVSGIQLKPGAVYESYPGNIVGKGNIKMTAFNRQGYFNGRGILGTIVFKAKPGVEKTTISFDFSPGRTTDSNVADVDSNDILNGAYGATYTFKPGKCGSDTTPPDVSEQKPAPGEINVPLDSEIVFTLTDNMSGVDINSVKVEINDITYKYDKTDDSTFKAEGKPNRYKITIRPTKPFMERAPVIVKISGMDLNGNPMADQTYAFNELMPVTACQPRAVAEKPVACEPCDGALRSAAPEVGGFRLGIWSLWFVLLCSLIYNLKHLLAKQKKKEAIAKKTGSPIKTPTKRKRGNRLK